MDKYILFESMTTKQFIPYTRQEIDEADIQAVAEALKKPLITRGDFVQAFEKEVAAYVEAPFALAFNSGSSALNGVAFALGLGPQDRVISTPNTFISTVGSTIERGANPVFIDIDPYTGLWQNDLALVNLHTEHSRGRDILMPVHFTGATVDMKFLNKNLTPEAHIVEDAAHAFGSTYSDGKKVGASHLSDMTVFSFHPSKTITTGEGGMVTTHSEELYELLKLARNNGIYNSDSLFPGSYDVLDLTCNYNFTDFQAALGLSQLKKVDRFIKKRRSLVAYYREKLQSIPEIVPLSGEQDDRSAHHLFVVLIDFKKFGKDRRTVMQSLKEKGVGTQLHYIPLYHHPIFKDHVGDISEFFPQTEFYYERALSLPLYTQLEKEEIDYVAASLKEVLGI